jgi:NAD-dependent oxidoreductase involved in siderophore biosynthesis
MSVQRVVVKFNDGRYKIWADYGQVVWGSPAYEVLDYFPDLPSAREAIRRDRKGDYVQIDASE